MKFADKDNHCDISDDNDGNDEATFDSGECAPINTLPERPKFLCCFIDMIWQANNPVTTASITYSAHPTKTKYKIQETSKYKTSKYNNKYKYE